jgi:APA family basic amino acid/polyamine antiporter
MYNLPKVTWIRFGGWLLAGLAVYFLYSVKHSRLQQALRNS